MLLKRKIARVREVYDIACSLDATIGEPVFGRGFRFAPESRRIAFKPNTILLLHPGRFIKMGWANGHIIREITEFRDDCVVFEVHRFGKAVMQANIAGNDDVNIYRYEPGAWEMDMGLPANGDTIPVLPNLFIDEYDPYFVAWLEKNPRPAHGRLIPS